VTRPDSYEELASELEDVAERLRTGELGQDEAADLVRRSAELAGRLGAEIDARGRDAERLEGQERLL
jgi:hypothetical protein